MSDNALEAIQAASFASIILGGFSLVAVMVIYLGC